MRAATLVALVAAVILGGCKRDLHGGTLARIQKRGEIRWGADLQGGEPYIYEDPNDRNHIIGFEVDIMDALARHLGVKQKVVHYNWSNLVPSLERGDFDVVMNGLEATADRADRILLSRPYFVYAETLAVRKGSKFRSLDDLRGHRVGTLNQTYAHDLLRERPVDVVLYEGNEEPYMDLENGRVDGVLLDNIIADRYGCNRAAIECLPDDVARGTYVIGIRKADPELRDAINQALDAMVADGELEAILRKANLWDHRQTEPPPPIPAATGGRAEHFDLQQLQRFVSAAGVTLALSVASFLLAVPIGMLLAVGRVYGGPIARGAARAYIELFRGTPVLLQLYVIYYGLAPYYAFGPVQAAVLGLGLNYAAYEAEVYRGALLAVPRGQLEAARALGLGPWQSLRHVVGPQALRLALPPMTNDFVALLKDSSLVSVITVIELTKRMTIAATDLRGWLVPGLACAGLYLILSLPLSELARRLERRLARDQRPHTL
ncbi:MAG TPA: ABC transporter substrate-binding protein/permease [Kofleriaceae bacterium]|nr:ABC transporter substrate-binding protein/permease [Kofleriaceae bacterium]